MLLRSIIYNLVYCACPVLMLSLCLFWMLVLLSILESGALLYTTRVATQTEEDGSYLTPGDTANSGHR